MKNKKLIAALIGLVIAALVALKADLEKPELAPVEPEPAPVAADAGV
jgi:hypothetical protein